MAPYNTLSDRTVANRCFELRFLPRPGEGRSLAFPCNVAGDVEIDGLNEHERIASFHH